MTCYIAEESQSSLKDGIETIVIPIHDPNDMEQLVFHTQRGGIYDVVEWLLSELYRQTELERVVGLTVTPNHNQIVVNLELKQPGLQLEQWLKQYLSPGAGRCLTMNNEGTKVLMDYEVILSARSIGQGKFTDQHRPWWEKDIQFVPGDLTG